MGQDNHDSKESRLGDENPPAKPSPEEKAIFERPKEDDLNKRWTRAEWFQFFIAIFTGGYLIITIFMWYEMIESNKETRRNNAETRNATEESLQLTRDSLKIGNENLEQTKKSVDLSKKAFETTQRAWLVFSQATPSKLSSRDDPIKVIISNKGHVPAVDTKSGVLMFESKDPLPDMSLDEIIGRHATSRSQGILGPGDIFTIPMSIKQLDEGTFKRIQIGSLQLYIIGAAKYRDAFYQRSLKFCIVYIPDRGGWNLCPNNNSVE